MFGIVSSIIVGLLRSLYGLSPSVSGGAASSVTGIFDVKDAAGVTRFRVAPATPQTRVGSRLQLVDTVAGLASVDIHPTLIRILSGSQFIFSASATDAEAAGDVGLERVAVGVAGVTNGSTGAGWFQNQAGDLQVTAADVTNVTTTPADITALTATLAAGRRYRFTLVARVLSATATDGVRFDFGGGTATATLFWANGIITDTLTVRPLQEVTALATDITDTLTTGAALVVIEGHITVNGAGTFIPRFAKEADAAGATATLFVGSSLIVKDMP